MSRHGYLDDSWYGARVRCNHRLNRANPHWRYTVRWIGLGLAWVAISVFAGFALIHALSGDLTRVIITAMLIYGVQLDDLGDRPRLGEWHGWVLAILTLISGIIYF